MSKAKYSSNIKDMGLLNKEMKIAADTYIGSNDLESIVGKSISFNIFLVNTERRKKDLADKIIRRLGNLDDFLIEKISIGSADTVRQLALFALMKDDLLLFEFMNEIFKDKLLLNDARITEADFNRFFKEKIQTSDIVASWKQPNVEKVKSAIRKTIIESGLGKRFGNDIKIMPPIMDRLIREHIKENGDEKYLIAMGVNS